MPELRYVNKVGGLMVAHFTDGTSKPLYPTPGSYWKMKGAGTAPPPVDPPPTDPGTDPEAPAPTFQRLTGQTSPNSSPRSAYGPYGEAPTGITIHHWGEEGQQFQNVVDFLCNPASQVSAHCVVEDGRVAFLVPYTRAAWHAGSNEGNGTTIGLELRPEATDGDYATAAALIREIRGTYGNLPLYPHNHWFNTACPGKWDLARLNNMANAAPEPPPTNPTPTGKWVHPLPRGILTSGYGPRGGQLHAGADISTPKADAYGRGGDILATTDLRITVAKEMGTGGLDQAGTYVKGHTISGTAYSFSHFHGHPGTLAVSVGQVVTAGTKLMNEGNSGNSFGSHLHLEIWPGHMPGDYWYWGDGTPPDPLPILRANGISI